jgi:uncharacterized membrane protein
MRGWRKWLVATLIVAVASHLICLFGLPHLVSRIIWRRVANYGPVNTFVHAPRATADLREIVLPSPDLLYGVCVFDVADRPLHIESGVADSYWSLAMYADNSDIFFVLDRREVNQRHCELLLIGPHAKEPSDFTGRIIRSPSSRGLIMVRTLISSEQDLPKLLAIQRSAISEPWLSR